MRSTIRPSLFAIALTSISQLTFSVILEGRALTTSDINRAAQTTQYPTVPVFTAPSFTYGAFSQVYPSGYSLPTAPFVTTTAISSTVSTGSSPSEDPQASYLSAMCAPQSTKQRGWYKEEQKFPCNRVANSSNTCLYNATRQEVIDHGDQLREVGPQAQKDCLCPGGKGEKIWEDIEGCDTCIRLHGGAPADASSAGIGFIPTAYIKDLSSAYCAQQTASNNWEEFYGNFSATHTMSFGTETQGPDVLKSKTAVSNYFTETSSHAPTITGGSQSGQAASVSLKPVSTKSSLTSQPPASSTSTAVAVSTGSANALKTSTSLSIGLLGVLWLL